MRYINNVVCKHDRAYIYDRLIGSKGVRCLFTCSDICKNQHSTSQLPQNISCFFFNKIVWIFLACQMKLMIISSCCPWNVRLLFLIFNERCFINKKVYNSSASDKNLVQDAFKDNFNIFWVKIQILMNNF